MKALILAAALALTGPIGCATVTDSPLELTATDERFLYGVEAAYNAVLNSVNAAIDAGLVTPGSPEALGLANRLDTARETILVARRAYAAGNASSGYSLALQALALIGEVQEAIGER